MAAPLYTGLAMGACLIRSMSDVYGPGALALYEAATAVPNAMLCPGRTPSLRSSSEMSPSSALTICTKNTIAIQGCSTAGVVERKEEVSGAVGDVEYLAHLGALLGGVAHGGRGAGDHARHLHGVVVAPQPRVRDGVVVAVGQRAR